MKEQKFTITGYDSFSNEKYLIGSRYLKQDAIDEAKKLGGPMNIVYVHDQDGVEIYRAGTY